MGSTKRLFSMVAVVMMLAAPTAAMAEAPPHETAAEHLALAKKYRDKAAAYRAEADEHRKMAEQYKANVAAPGSPKETGENPWAKKMEAHCRAIAAEADKLAADEDKAAEYHTLRAKELQGK